MVVGQPTILRNQDTTHITEWVDSTVKNGDVKRIIDPRFRGNFDVNCVWKAVELALACASRIGTGITMILGRAKVLSMVGLLQDDVDPMVSVMKVEKAPLESYADIGGLDAQIQEIKEAVELPLTHPELYEDIGIKHPKGVILYGEPGTGKTLLSKAVANSTSATFLRVVGSELIQKYLGDGPKLVRELFRVADDPSPFIVFIDEIDVGTKRYDAHSSGFDSRGDVQKLLIAGHLVVQHRRYLSVTQQNKLKKRRHRHKRDCFTSSDG